MRKQFVAILMMFAGGFLFTNLEAQDFSKQTIQGNAQALRQQQIQQNDFDEQIESILKYFSSLVGTGFVHTAALHQIAGFDVGLRGVITVVPDELKNIVPKGTPNVTDPLTGHNDAIPVPFLHASLGLPGNLEIMGKFFTVSVADKPGSNVTLLGGALKYGLLQGNIALPAITLLGGFQTLIVPDEYAFGNVSTFSLKGYISKGFTIATVYGGLGLDFTRLKLDIPGFPDLNKTYDVTYPNGVVGLTITPFPLVRVNADYNFGALKNISLGIGVSLR